MGRLLSRDHHCSEGRSHSGRAIDLCNLHAGNDHPGDNFPCETDDGILGRIHVQCLHAGNGINQSDALQALDTSGTEWPIMSTGTHHNLGLHDIGVHARLCVVIHRDQSPIRHNSSHSVLLDDQILGRYGVEELDIGPGQDLAQDGRCEEGCVLYDHIVLQFVVGDLKFVQEKMGRLSDHHGREQLPTEPRTSARAHRLLNNGHLYIGVLAELVGAGKSCATRTHHHHIGVCMSYHVCHVASGHLPCYYRLLNGFELEALQIIFWVGIQRCMRCRRCPYTAHRTRYSRQPNPTHRRRGKR
eukprot:Gb_40595 [translate_table: standard]